MYLTRSEYDRGVNTFSPEGRLFQVGLFVVLHQSEDGHVLSFGHNPFHGVQRGIDLVLWEPLFSLFSLFSLFNFCFLSSS